MGEACARGIKRAVLELGGRDVMIVCGDADVSRVFAAAHVTTYPQFWVSGSKGFSEDSEPHEVGHSFANVWQGVLDIVQTHNGVRLPIDVNVASVPSPSSHEYALGD